MSCRAQPGRPKGVPAESKHPYPHLESRTVSHHDESPYFFQNRPTPTRTCTVFSPGFGVANPAFEICR